MRVDTHHHGLITLDPATDGWTRFYTVAPLVLVGTREPDGRYDLAPKHMVTPLGHEGYFGFVCTPRHGTYANVAREQAFTVSFPRPAQIVLASMSAAPRCGDDVKHALEALPQIPARTIDGVFLADSYLFLECRLDRIVDGFGDFSLIAGRIEELHVAADSLRDPDVDDGDLIRENAVLAFLAPDRYARIEDSLSFPFHEGMRR